MYFSKLSRISFFLSHSWYHDWASSRLIFTSLRPITAIYQPPFLLDLPVQSSEWSPRPRHHRRRPSIAYATQAPDRAGAHGSDNESHQLARSPRHNPQE